MHNRADRRLAPSQWETVVLCNDVSHWLGTSLESTLHNNYHKLMIVCFVINLLSRYFMINQGRPDPGLSVYFYPFTPCAPWKVIIRAITTDVVISRLPAPPTIAPQGTQCMAGFLAYPLLPKWIHLDQHKNDDKRFDVKLIQWNYM